MFAQEQRYHKIYNSSLDIDLHNPQDYTLDSPDSRYNKNTDDLVSTGESPINQDVGNTLGAHEIL